MRPAYFSFELLARLTGARLEARSNDESVHAFLTFDKDYDYYSLMFWNFSATPVTIDLNVKSLPGTLTAHRRELNATAPSQDENARMHPLEDLTLASSGAPPQIHLEPYGIQFWSLEQQGWPAQIMGHGAHSADPK
jgi:hypothetical protein